MKKIMILCGLLCALLTFARAQQGNPMPDPKEMALKSAETMAPKLKLNAKQKEKLVLILTGNNQKIVRALNDTHGDQQAMGTAANKITTETDAAINAMLTAVQKKNFLAWKQSMRNINGPKQQ